VAAIRDPAEQDGNFQSQKTKTRLVLRRASGTPITPTISTVQVMNTPDTIKEQPCRMTKNMLLTTGHAHIVLITK